MGIRTCYLRFWKPVRYEAEAEAEEDDSLLRRVDGVLDALNEIGFVVWEPHLLQRLRVI